MNMSNFDFVQYLSKLTPCTRASLINDEVQSYVEHARIRN